MTTRKTAPLHVRLVLVNGVVFAFGVLAMSLAPEDRRGVTAAVVLAVGLALIVAVNTRHLRRSLEPLTSAFGSMRERWERDGRSQAARSLAGKEYDGQRMSRALHDHVADNLAAALVGLERAMRHASPELADELRTVRHRTRLGLVEVRRIGRTLRPELLDDMGLHSALGALPTQLAVRGVEVHRHLEGPFDLDGETEVIIYKVAEEALRNVARHAEARNVDLSLQQEGGSLVLRVGDDGIGLDGSPERTGILAMRERAALVGGMLAVGPGARGGTQVRLVVPLSPPSG